MLNKKSLVLMLFATASISILQSSSTMAVENSDCEDPLAVSSHTSLVSFFNAFEGGSWWGTMKITRINEDGSLFVRTATGAVGLQKDGLNRWRGGEGFCTSGETPNLCWDGIGGFRVLWSQLFSGFGDYWTPVKVLESTPLSLVYIIQTGQGLEASSTTVHEQILPASKQFIRHELFRSNGRITESRVFSGKRE